MEKLLLPPDESLAKLIKAQLNETDDQKLEHNLKLFEKWIECQPHLPKNYEKNMLKTYLRGTKHDLEAAKRKFEIYFVFKSALPSLWQFKPFNEEELKIVHNFSIAVMPHLTDEGYRLTVFTIRDKNTDLFDCNLLMKNIWRFGHARACKEDLIAGDVHVFDAANATPAHIAILMKPSFRNSLRLSQEGFSCRMNQIHVVNAPVFADKFVSVCKMFLKEKLRNRFFVDRGISSLKEHISARTLPKDYGGLGEHSHEVFLRCMRFMDENQSWLEEQEEIKLIGEIPEKISTSMCEFGAEGSFRQLSFD